MKGSIEHRKHFSRYEAIFFFASLIVNIQQQGHATNHRTSAEENLNLPLLMSWPGAGMHAISLAKTKMTRARLDSDNDQQTDRKWQLRGIYVKGDEL